MRKISYIIFLLFGLLYSEELTAVEIAAKVYNAPQPLDSESEITMTLFNKKKNRSKKSVMHSISKDEGNKLLLFFKAPKKDRGIGFLKIESPKNDKLVLFIPALNKPRRISAKNQSDSFMKSDLSYEDMLSPELDDFTYNLLDKEDGFYILERIPIDNNSEYSRHESWVSKDTFLIQKEKSYDQKGILLKNKSFKHQNIDGFNIISEIDVTNVQKKHQTVLSISNISINSDIDDSEFQEKNLKRWKKYIK